MLKMTDRLSALEQEVHAQSWFHKMIATALATAIVGIIVTHLAWR